MKLIYTDHLKTRLKHREIALNLVREIFDKSKEYYWDNLRHHRIVISTVNFKGKYRKVLAAYDTIKKGFEVITIHPITDEEIKKRLLSGRWSYEKNKN